MTFANALRALLLLVAVTLLGACIASPPPPEGTPAPCSENADCGDGVQCLHTRDDATGVLGPGFCDVREHIVSTTQETAAPCSKDSDCGPAGPCLHVQDDDGADVGAFCRTDDIVCPRFCEMPGL